MNLKCAGCGKAHQEVRLLVALSDKLHVCNECVDICVDICADTSFGGDGFVRVATQELEALRRQAHQATLAKIWMNRFKPMADHQLPPRNPKTHHFTS